MSCGASGGLSNGVIQVGGGAAAAAICTPFRRESLLVCRDTHVILLCAICVVGTCHGGHTSSHVRVHHLGGTRGPAWEGQRERSAWRDVW